MVITEVSVVGGVGFLTEFFFLGGGGGGGFLASS